MLQYITIAQLVNAICGTVPNVMSIQSQLPLVFVLLVLHTPTCFAAL